MSQVTLARNIRQVVSGAWGSGGRPEIRRNTLRSRRQSDFNKIGSPCERLVHFRDPNSLSAPPYESSKRGKFGHSGEANFPLISVSLVVRPPF